MLQRPLVSRRSCLLGQVSNPISGEVGAAAGHHVRCKSWRECLFQTPSAGRWVLQLRRLWQTKIALTPVSNPISGEVGAAAPRYLEGHFRSPCRFQTPSAGRWVLQHALRLPTIHSRIQFQTPSAGRWVLQHAHFVWQHRPHLRVSNPISGEVGAAAGTRRSQTRSGAAMFQTPSAGRRVLQLAFTDPSLLSEGVAEVSNPISGEVGAAAPL